MSHFIDMLLLIGQGIWVTLFLLAGGMVLGLLIGSSFAILRYRGTLRRTIDRFVSIMRGTPLILQLAFVYFALPNIGFRLSILEAGILTFGLNSAAYLAETLRAGIESVPKGQFEAAATLHISPFFLWKDIILPQVVQNVWPAIVNELIALLKETALISTIGGMDIMRSAQTVAAEQFTYFMPLCIAGLYYYLFVLLIEFAGKKVERKIRNA